MSNKIPNKGIPSKNPLGKIHISKQDGVEENTPSSRTAHQSDFSSIDKTTNVPQTHGIKSEPRTIPAKDFYDWENLKPREINKIKNFGKGGKNEDLEKLYSLYPTASIFLGMYEDSSQCRVASITKENGEHCIVAKDKDANFKEIFTFPNNKDYYENTIMYKFRLSRDSKRVELIYPIHERKNDVYASISIENPKDIKILAEDPNYDVRRVLYSPHNDNPIAYSYLDTDKDLKVKWKVLDSKYKKHFEKLFEEIKKLEYRQKSIEKIDINDDGSIWTVFVTDSDTPFTRYEFELVQNESDYIHFKPKSKERLIPTIRTDELPESKLHKLKGYDGKELTALLTLPQNQNSASDLPLIVMAHGGPHLAYENKFDPETQFLINRGYAILQINHRGSTGHGTEFRRGIYKNLRAAAQDLISATKDAINKNLISSNNLSLYGRSFGGYITAKSIELEPDLFQRAIISAPVLDWNIELEEVKERNKITKRGAGSIILKQDYIDFELDAINPQKIKIPTLILYGKKDKINKDSDIGPSQELQIKNFANNLSSDTPCTRVCFEGEGHLVQYKSAVCKRLEIMNQFLKKDNEFTNRKEIKIEHNNADPVMGFGFGLELIK